MIIPQVKQQTLSDGVCKAAAFAWHFADNTDARVMRAAERLCPDTSTGTPVYISHRAKNCESYHLTVTPDRIDIDADGAAGAFYALSTLKMLRKSGAGQIACQKIADAPDMAYRGFYHDASRGRIHTIERLKALVDTMADYKLNSLQLYIEHTYEFREYDFCRELGYLTHEEIRELDSYCIERFVELVPSLSTFGHLYHLLQSDRYKHLCELSDYQPRAHHYLERMGHHTINPLLDESFALITSLIDQHMEAFSSNKFNICCDETFDLGRDVNAGKDKGDLYIDFVKKLIAYLEARGKTVMMWGDIVLKHPERISELPDRTIFLNWYYHEAPTEDRFIAFQNNHQIVCPGTSAWCGFHEYIDIETPNILKMVAYGKKYGTIGILNTNWGDLGNPATLEMSMYGLILGAAAGWNNDTQADDEFNRFIASYHYGCPDAVEFLKELSVAPAFTSWPNFFRLNVPDATEADFVAVQERITSLIKRIRAASFASDICKEAFLLAAEADSLLVSWSAARMKFHAPSPVDFDAWIETYAKNWRRDCKESELETLLALFRDGQAQASAI